MASASPLANGTRFLPREGCRRARDTAGGASAAVSQGSPVSATGGRRGRESLQSDGRGEGGVKSGDEK